MPCQPLKSSKYETGVNPFENESSATQLELRQFFKHCHWILFLKEEYSKKSGDFLAKIAIFPSIFIKPSNS